MKYYDFGTRKSVDKKGNIIEVKSIVPVKSFIQKCKVEGCSSNRANGSSRCQAHKKESNALPQSTQLPSSS